MTGRPRFKPSLRQQMEDSERWNKFYALMGDKPIVSLGAPLPPKRMQQARTLPDDKEAAVTREVWDVLKVHPRVMLAWRQNSGMAQSASGAPVWFFRFVRKPCDKITLTDYLGVADFGLFAIECKRRGWTYTGTDREVKQRNLIEFVRSVGGRGGFVTSGEEAEAILA